MCRQIHDNSIHKNERKEEKKLLLLLQKEREREREDTTGDLGLCWAVVVKIWGLARKRDPTFLAHVVFFWVGPGEMDMSDD
jgi:hypothetical protein